MHRTEAFWSRHLRRISALPSFLGKFRSLAPLEAVKQYASECAQHSGNKSALLQSPEAKCFQKRVPSGEELIDDGLHDYGDLHVVLHLAALCSRIFVS